MSIRDQGNAQGVVNSVTKSSQMKNTESERHTEHPCSGINYQLEYVKIAGTLLALDAENGELRQRIRELEHQLMLETALQKKGE